MNLRIGKIGRLFAPGYGQCLRCETPWKFVDPHSTRYTSGASCFCLCEKCWEELGMPKARMRYYEIGCSHRDEWPAIEQAVLAGK